MNEVESRLGLLQLARKSGLAMAASTAHYSREGLPYESEDEADNDDDENNNNNDNDIEKTTQQAKKKELARAIKRSPNLQLEPTSQQSNNNTSSPAAAVGVGAFSSKWDTQSRQLLRQQMARSERSRDAGTSHDFQTEASSNWHQFYKRNTNKFYKDRHYLLHAFPLLGQELERMPIRDVSLLEVGCGVGNAMMPLAETHSNLHAYGVDFAGSAIEILHKRPSFIETGSHAYVCDVTFEELPDEIPMVDAALCLFVLSAMTPEKIEAAFKRVVARVKPGGLILIRDYAMYDMAQLRFAPDQRLGHNLYVRQDGTQSFFFTQEGLDQLASRQAGLQCIDTGYVRRVVRNLKLGTKMHRCWINATYMKPTDV